MATTISLVVAQILPSHKTNNNKPNATRPSVAALPTRRQCLLLLTATTALTAVGAAPSRAKDIPLFGLRQGLRKAEQEGEQIVKEEIVAAENGIEAAEKGIETTEKEIIETAAVSFGGLAQAGVVAGAEVVGVLIASSVVNGILGPEAQKS